MIKILNKICVECGKEYQRHYGQGMKTWNKRKFCSHPCYSKSLKDKKKCPRSVETKNKISKANSGEGNGMYGKKTWNTGTIGICKPNSGSFKKGMIPWNAGTIGICKLNSGSFKKRMIPWNKKILKIVITIIKKVSKNIPKKKFVPWNKGKKCPNISKGKIGKKRPDMVGNTHGFKKGMIPWCKDLKGIHLSPKTEFKKGIIPWNKDREHIAVKGKRNHNWKGGITGLIEQIRKCLKYRIWRKTIFERDYYTCQNCKIKKGNQINAHHIKEFSVIIKENNIKTLEDAEKCEELWKTSNGITLCKKCHKKVNNHEQKYYSIFTEILKFKLFNQPK